MPDTTTPVSGPRHVLDDGRVRLEVGEVAAVLAELRVGGVRVTETVPVDALPPGGCGIVLAPWPNRVRDATWTLDGEPQHLAVTDPKAGAASHGLLRNTAYRVRERTSTSITLGALIAPQHGWPFLLDTTVRYALEADGIAVTHTAVNLGAAPAPWAVGAHPYFRVGETPVDDLVVTVTGVSAFDLDERLLPVGETSVDGSPLDLRAGRRVGDVDINSAYRLPASSADRVEVASLAAPDGSRTVVWHGPGVGFTQVYTPRAFARPDGEGLAIAIEPMTAAPDALNSGDGLAWLAPGDRHDSTWGVRLERSAA